MSMGEKIPVVFFPRFTTIASNTQFWSQPMDMLGFASFGMMFYRAVITGGGAPTPTAGFLLQQSSDLTHWDDIGTEFDPSATNVEGWQEVPGTVGQRYLRIGVRIINGSNPAMTFWVQGWASRTMQ